MIRDRATAEENHNRFVKRSIEHESVWGLKGPNGYGWCESNDHDDRDVLIFWSDRAYAERARKSEFSGFELSEISLFDFLFRWLTSMSEDGLLVGTNWTGDLVGIEIEPDELKDQLIESMPQEMIKKYLEQLKKSIAEQSAAPDAKSRGVK